MGGKHVQCQDHFYGQGILLWTFLVKLMRNSLGRAGLSSYNLQNVSLFLEELDTYMIASNSCHAT